MEISTVLYGLALVAFFVLLGIVFTTPVLKKYKTLEHVQEPEAVPTSPVNGHIGETHTLGEWKEIWRNERTSSPTSEAEEKLAAQGEHAL